MYFEVNKKYHTVKEVFDMSSSAMFNLLTL